MKYVSVEQLWRVLPNKYLALNVAALEARRLIDAISRDEIQLPGTPYEYALRRLLREELKFVPLTEEEILAASQPKSSMEGKRKETEPTPEPGSKKSARVGKTTPSSRRF